MKRIVIGLKNEASVIAWCYRTGKGGQFAEKPIALRAVSVAFSI